MDKKEKRKEYMKEYWEKNNEDKKEYNKIYREKNKEQIKERKKEYDKKYRENNIEKLKYKKKEYKQTENGKKSTRILDWKKIGVIHDDFDALYHHYINCKNCEKCDVELVEGRITNSRCLDHEHKTGLFRNVLCRACNVKRKEDNF